MSAQTFVSVVLAPDAVPVHGFLESIWIWVVDKVLGSLIAGLVIVFIGSWWIARVNERYRGERDHLAKSVDALRLQIESLVKVASAYWIAKQSPVSSSLEGEIDYRLVEISSLVELCARDLWNTTESEGPVLFGRLVATVVTPTYSTAKRAADVTRPSAIAQAAGALSAAVLSERGTYFALKSRVARTSKPALAPNSSAE